MTLQVIDPNQIKESVRAYYGEKARSVAAGSACGCGCSPAGDDVCCGSESQLYNADELALVPADAAEVSLGCGNPTAIAALSRGEIVLDLGSGGGIDVFLAARQVGDAGFVYGVDMTDDMLALARRNAAKVGATNVEFRKGHIEELPLPDASVDVIISNCVINLSPDKGQTLHEAFRVLKPGGRLAISDIVIDGTLDDLPVSEAQIRTALSWAGCIAGALTVAQYTHLLASAGFAGAEVELSHRYHLEELGQIVDQGSVDLPDDVLRSLVQRFASGAITAVKPVAAL